MRYHSCKVDYFCSFFGRIEDSKKTLRNLKCVQSILCTYYCSEPPRNSKQSLVKWNGPPTYYQQNFAVDVLLYFGLIWHQQKYFWWQFTWKNVTKQNVITACMPVSRKCKHLNNFQVSSAQCSLLLYRVLDLHCELVSKYTLAYLGAYGAHMFALLVWVGGRTSKTIEKGSLKIRNLYFWFYIFENASLGAPWLKESKSVLRFKIAW